MHVRGGFRQPDRHRPGIERRWLVPREQFAAVSYGDPLLAVAAGLGVWLTGARTPHGLTGQAAGVATVVIMLAFGLVQWRDELRRDYYTRAQAAAPTKIWHQLVIYPVLGYWLWTAGVGGLSTAGGAAAWAGKALLLALVGIWAAPTCTTAATPSSATRPSTGAAGGRSRGPGRPSRRRCEQRDHRRCKRSAALPDRRGLTGPASRFCEVLYRFAALALALCWYAQGGPARRGGEPGRRRRRQDMFRLPSVHRPDRSHALGHRPVTRNIGVVTDSRKCEQCGVAFAPRREHARFCSARCRVAWNRLNARESPAEGGALDWTITAMRETVDRLLRARGWDRPHAFAVISEAVWWVTMVDATLVRSTRTPTTESWRVTTRRSAAPSRARSGACGSCGTRWATTWIKPISSSPDEAAQAQARSRPGRGAPCPSPGSTRSRPAGRSGR